MATQLRLVSNNVHRTGRPRPYSTYYYKGKYVTRDDWYRSGHASSPTGAVKAAVTKIMDHGYDRVDIYDQFDLLQYRVSLSAGGSITIRRM